MKLFLLDILQMLLQDFVPLEVLIIRLLNFLNGFFLLLHEDIESFVLLRHKVRYFIRVIRLHLVLHSLNAIIIPRIIVHFKSFSL